MEEEKKNQYISLKQASLISGYHPDYLGFLIRKGKIEGMKVGKTWLTTEKAVLDYLSEVKIQKKRTTRRIILLKGNEKKIMKKIVFISLFSVFLVFLGFLLGQQHYLVSSSPEGLPRQKNSYSEKTSDQSEKIVINVYSQNPLDVVSQLRSTINSFLESSNGSGLMISNSIKNLKY